jgi:hypothetical protein
LDEEIVSTLGSEIGEIGQFQLSGGIELNEVVHNSFASDIQKRKSKLTDNVFLPLKSEKNTKQKRKFFNIFAFFLLQNLVTF